MATRFVAFRKSIFPIVAFLAGGALFLGISNLQQSGSSNPASWIASTAEAAKVRKPEPMSTVDVVERVSPGIVNVGVIKRTVVYDPVDDYFSPFMWRKRTVRQKTPYLGSGFLIDQDGYILTNVHVIEDSEEVFVTFPDGREVPAKIVDADRFVDVAILKVDLPADELPEPVELGDSDALQIGQTAHAFGNPFGNLIDDPRPTVTRGVVSALHRSFQPDTRAMRVYQDMIQTDAAINPGNSGGPLIDELGQVIGINTFIFTPSGGSIGLGFAIPINRAKAILKEVKEFGQLRPLRIDFGVMPLNTPRIQGVIVTSVADDGPAQEAGMEAGDVILSVDGRRVATRQDFILLVVSKQVGDTVKLEIWRDGKTREVDYKISGAGSYEG